MRRTRAIDQLIEPVDAPEDGNEFALGVDGKLSSTTDASRISGVARVDEANDRQPGPRSFAQAASQAATIPAGSHDQDAPR